MHDPLTVDGSGWSLTLWMKTDESNATTLLAGVGDPLEEFPRYLGLRDGRPFFWAGEQHFLTASAPVAPGAWHSLAVFVQGPVTHLLVDGVEAAHGELSIGPSTTKLQLAPTVTPTKAFHHFGGLLALVSLSRGFTADQKAALLHPDQKLDDLTFEDASKSWPVQTKQWTGLRAPQDPGTLPRSTAPSQTPKAMPEPHIEDLLSKDGRTLTLSGGWHMAEAAAVHDDGEHISAHDFDDSHWYAAVVPGTVLTTLVARGVYPDPDYGLNNMAIPDSLSHRSFWFRTHFTAPDKMLHGHPRLTFNGINYHAEIWLNGKRLGEMQGAFNRGRFDVGEQLVSGNNTLAVLISPPPHPGIPHEQSLSAGPGPNGGLEAIDGPTFAATEGWDWMPGIRDRDMGIWQDVTLTAEGVVSLDNPEIITRLPLPDTNSASITIKIPVANASSEPVHGALEIAFEGVELTHPITLPPGNTTVTLTPAEFPQLKLKHPRLWWPNGYGQPNLYHLTARFRIGSGISDERTLRFGVREITYELSLLDSTGHLRRVEVDPTEAALTDEPLVDERHEAIRETPLGWVASLTATGEHSPAVHDLHDLATQPALVLRVNGVRIAVRGGSWGMDDMMKRVSRAHLEPFFRLHREAHLNMIRNWMGQNTEEVFYELADEYGLLVWNDFWDSTQDDNIEPDDSALFLRNAKDTILRFRNHPSIAVWCGRNEGVPAPAVNEGLIRLIAKYDGTRLYSASSNRVNLHSSGPYKYQDPSEYFTHLALGFAVELGLPSPPTLETFESFLPKADLWPISDDWAYHDWHQGRNGDVAPFMRAMDEKFGPPSSIEDFDRKAQMLNYVGHRAVFEGFNAHLWSPNSGRMLWMTQPAWPSTEWQIFSHDYDTQASYYGVQHASEPVHVQLNLPDYGIAIVNNTTSSLPRLNIRARIYSLDSKLLFEHAGKVDAAANATSNAFRLSLDEALAHSPVVFVRLDLTDPTGKLVSQNFYWLAARDEDYRKLDSLPVVALQTSATTDETKVKEQHITVTLSNPSQTVAIETKLTLLDSAAGSRILPAYYSDNYISLLPGEQREVQIAYPSEPEHRHPVVTLRGWNVKPATITVDRP